MGVPSLPPFLSGKQRATQPWSGLGVGVKCTCLLSLSGQRSSRGQTLPGACEVSPCRYGNRVAAPRSPASPLGLPEVFCLECLAALFPVKGWMVRVLVSTGTACSLLPTRLRGPRPRAPGVPYPIDADGATDPGKCSLTPLDTRYDGCDSHEGHIPMSRVHVMNTQRAEGPVCNRKDKKMSCILLQSSFKLGI